MARRLSSPVAADPAGDIRALPPLGIAPAVAAGVDPLRAAFDAVRAHPAVQAARADWRNDRELAVTNAVGNLAWRTVVSYTKAHGQPTADELPELDESTPF